MSAPPNILVFRTGQLGDTLVALPALHVIRREHPGAQISLLTNRDATSGDVPPELLLAGSGLVDRYIAWPEEHVRGLARRAALAGVWWKLLRQRFQALYYLVPSDTSPPAIVRDECFFRAAGIRKIIGMGGFPALPEPRASGWPEHWPQVNSEADLLLARLAADGIEIPGPGEGSMDLRLSTAEHQAVETWSAAQAQDGGRRWVGIGPGARFPAKVWPAERFSALVSRLIESHDIWPVVFGGPEDRILGDRMVAEWGRGYVAAGPIKVREAAKALARCELFIGGDTGTTHLAAAVGTPCVAVFAARDWRGRWYPYGTGHTVLSTAVECQGCGLRECLTQRRVCLTEIDAHDVGEACVPYLQPKKKRGRRVS